MTVQKTFFSGAVTANLGVVRVVERELRLAGRPLTIEELEARLLVGDHAQNLAVLGTSLSVSAAIGFFRVDGSLTDKLTTISQSDAVDGSTEPNEIAEAFLETLGEYSIGQLAEGSAVPDLALALAWVLRGDPRQPFSSWSNQKPNDPEVAIKGCGMGEVVSNSAQWNAFRRWAHSLGFVELTPVGNSSFVTADPTRCIGRLLPRLPARSTADAFVDSLRRLIPFMGGGRIGDALVEEFPDVPSWDADLGPATSHALYRLASQRRLELVKAEDAESSSLVSLSDPGSGTTGVIGEVGVIARD